MQRKLTPEQKAQRIAEKKFEKAEHRRQERELLAKNIQDTRERKARHKELQNQIKADKPQQKKYMEELHEFIKNDKHLIPARIEKVKAWYQTQDQNDKDVRYNYKWKLSEAKRTVFDYSSTIRFENTTYVYGTGTPFEFRALDNVDGLEIEPGKITAVIGMTGSGKSTLIQLTNGLITPNTGRTIIGNFQIPSSAKKIHDVKSLRKEIGLVFQFPEYQLFQDTIEKDIAFGPINLGQNKKDIIKRVPDLLKLVDLPEDYLKRSPFDLSGGQKRRVAIAGIIATDGNTLVLDEPTGGLDPQGEEDFMNIFDRLNKENGKRIIIVTHNMDHVLKIADNVIVMHKGKVIATGSPFDIFSNAELLHKIEIEPPKLYKLAHKLKDNGLDVTNVHFRTVEELVQAIKEQT